MLRGLVVLAMVGSLSGCISGACTAIGCVDQVTFQLDQATAMQLGVDQAVQVKACVGSQCVTETLTVRANSDAAGGQTLTYIGQTRTLEFRPMTSLPAGTQRVTLELTKGGTVVASLTKDAVDLSSFQPNGPGCAPVCRQATVTF